MFSLSPLFKYTLERAGRRIFWLFEVCDQAHGSVPDVRLQGILLVRS